MFNAYTDSQHTQQTLETITRDYFVRNQETESAFLNGLKQLNQLRIQTQAQNWTNFITKLNQITNTANNTHLYNPLFNISNNTNTTSITIQSQSQSEPQTSKPHTSNHGKHSQYQCEMNDCHKVYTTKGNLNRHLKDFHGLNSDLTPITKPKKKSNKTSQKKELNLSHTCSNESIPPPKPPKPHSNNNNGFLPSFPASKNVNSSPSLNLPIFNLSNANESNAHLQSESEYDGLDILLKAADALDKESKKRKYVPNESVIKTENICVKRRKISARETENSTGMNALIKSDL